MNDTDIRQLWAEVSQRLDAHDTLIRADREARSNLVAARSNRPAIVGQSAQIAFGALMLLLVAGLWGTLPRDPVVLLCGALLHLYGIAVIAMAGRAIARIRKIAFDRPLLESQLSLERAEEALVQSRMVAGQPWWFLWIAVPVVLLGKAGMTFSPHGTATAMIMLGVCILGMVATLIVRAQLIRRGVIDDPIGRQLRGARDRLDEIRRLADDGERPGQK
jgi:serine/threonine-protein kinase